MLKEGVDMYNRKYLSSSGNRGNVHIVLVVRYEILRLILICQIRSLDAGEAFRRWMDESLLVQ
jgi:hypothetical protein